MDENQQNHLKAYGIAYYAIERDIKVDWLLNYQGGSFLIKQNLDIEKECKLRNVSYNIIADIQSTIILQSISSPEVNQDVVRLERAPKIAIYSPKNKQPWDDAVTMALSYAEIPYEVVYDTEILNNLLPIYDWLHLHHEDFTGQYGKFWAIYRTQPWYIASVREQEKLAEELGFGKVSQLKLEVVHQIRDFVMQGGFMFAMCSATDTFDMALASENLDPLPTPMDGDPIDPNVNEKLSFENTFAFENFEMITDPYIYEHSNIDIEVDLNRISESLDYFTLFEFSAKWDPVPTMLTQNHVNSLRGFYGQATAFQKDKVKSSVVILAESPGRNQVKYVHGNIGRGTFTFYAGHDPEDYTHRVGDPPTDLSLHTNSPGYRLILNNILFPAAEKKKKQT